MPYYILPLTEVPTTILTLSIIQTSILTVCSYLRQAATMGSSDAEFELGQTELRDGRLDDALRHFRSAEIRGHVKSILSLARHYETGMGVEQVKNVYPVLSLP